MNEINENNLNKYGVTHTWSEEEAKEIADTYMTKYNAQTGYSKITEDTWEVIVFDTVVSYL